MSKGIKVKELIALLQQCPPDLPVVHEGCDCDGDAHHVVVEKDRVYITRLDYRDPATRNTVEIA